MPRDPRTYITVHDGMPDHPKMFGLSDAAFRLTVTCWCWCSRHRTDGRIPAGAWKNMGSPRARKEVVAAGLVVLDAAGDAHVHDYLEHQRSAEEIDELAAKRRDAGARGGRQRVSNLEANRQANAQASAQAEAKQAGSKTQAETETETDTQQTLAHEARESFTEAFEDFWATYPRRVGKQDARRAWDVARKKSSIEQILDAAERYAQDPVRLAADPKFTPHPATWLRQGRWDDELQSAAPARRAVVGGREVNTDDPDWWAKL